MSEYPKIFILGPQGAGKGTQAAKITKLLKIPHVVMSDLLLGEVKKNTTLGKKINSIITKGRLVPDAMSSAMMINRISQPDCRRGWLIDGFPRAKLQASYFNKKFLPNIIIHLHFSDTIAIQRLSGRRVCDRGHVYHLKYQPPRRSGYCDVDGLPLKIRYDDTPAAIRTRLNIFHRRTEPVIELYRKQATIIKVDARPSIDRVYRATVRELKKIPWLSSRLSKK